MFRLLVSLLVLLIPTLAKSESICVDYFAAQGFTSAQCNRALKVFDGAVEPCLGFLWSTFDRPKTGNLCVQRFLSKYHNRAHTLKVHFSNETMRRNGQGEKGAELFPELSAKDFSDAIAGYQDDVTNAVYKRAVKLDKWLHKHASEQARIIITTGLEDDYSAPAYDAISGILAGAVDPTYLIARNPNVSNKSKNHFPYADFIELHGTNPKFKANSGARCIASLDGYGIEFERGNIRRPGVLSLSEVLSFFERERNRGCLVFAWLAETQGRGSAKFAAPSRRNFRIYHKDINRINEFIRRFDQ